MTHTRTTRCKAHVSSTFGHSAFGANGQFKLRGVKLSSTQEFMTLLYFKITGLGRNINILPTLLKSSMSITKDIEKPTSAFIQQYARYKSDIKKAVDELPIINYDQLTKIENVTYLDLIDEGLRKIGNMTSTLIRECNEARSSRLKANYPKLEISVPVNALPKVKKKMNLNPTALPTYSKTNTGPFSLLSNTESKKRKYENNTDNAEDKCDAPNNSSGFNNEGEWVTVFVDGSCLDNGKLNARAGIGVWFNTNSPFNVSEPVQGRRTNNVAELEASIRAIEQAHVAGIKKLRIKTDSMFLINCVTKWRFNWMKNGWMTSAKQPVINKTELINLGNTMDKLPVEIDWVHVKAHSNIIGNEAADFLAKQGAEKCLIK